MRALRAPQGLAQYGNGFLAKFEAASCPNRLLEEISLVDTPGVLSHVQFHRRLRLVRRALRPHPAALRPAQARRARRCLPRGVGWPSVAPLAYKRRTWDVTAQDIRAAPASA